MELSKDSQQILRNLLVQRIIDGKHLPETICLRWIRHLPKQEHRKVIKEWKWCIKEGLVLTKPKPSDRHVFLNAKRIKEIKELIRNGEETNEPRNTMG